MAKKENKRKKSSYFRCAKLKLKNISEDFVKDFNAARNTGASIVREVMFTLAKMQGEPFYYRDSDGEEKYFNEDQIDNYLGKHKEDAQIFSSLDGFLSQATHARPFFFKQNVWKFNEDVKTWTDGKKAGLRLASAGFLPLLKTDIGKTKVKHSYLYYALGKFKSWVECNKESKNEKNEFLKKIEEFKEDIYFDEGCWNLFKDEFVPFAEANNVKLNGAFIRLWKQNKWDETLKKGKTPNTGCYSVKFFESLLPSSKFTSLLDKMVSYTNLLGLVRKCDGLKGYAVLTLPTEVDLHFSPRGNYLEYSLNQKSNELQLKVELPQHDDMHKVSNHYLSCCYSGYLRDLELKKEENGYRLRFRKSKSGELQEGVVKEPDVYYRNGEYYLSLPIDINVKPNSKFNPVTTGYIQDYFRTCLLNDTKEFKKKKESVQIGFTTISCDLNLNPLGQMAVYALEESCDSSLGPSFKVVDFGYANCKNKIKFGGTCNERNFDRISKFVKRCRTMRTAIWFFKELKKSKSDLEIPDLSNLHITPTLKPDELKQELAEAYKSLRKEYKYIRSLRLCKNELTSEYLYWIFALSNWIRVAKSWRYCEKPPRNKGDRPDPTDFSKLRRYLSNLKSNFIKKFGKAIRDYAVQNNANLVILEDLSDFKQELKNKRRTNYMLQLWSHRSITKSIEMALELDGIAVEFVDAARTSQEDPETGEPGYRDVETNKRHLYVERNGIVSLEDSDVCASFNLQRRFWTRYEDLNELKCELKVVENPHPNFKGAHEIAVPKLESSKRIRGALKYKFGKEYCILIKDKNTNVYWLHPVTKSQYKKYFTEKAKREPLKRIQDRWFKEPDFRGELRKFKDRCRTDSEFTQVFDL